VHFVINSIIYFSAMCRSVNGHKNTIFRHC